MKTLVTAQLSAHQSAGDVIGCVNGAGVMCCGRSMAQQSTSQKSAATIIIITSICLRAACSLFLNMLMTLKKKCRLCRVGGFDHIVFVSKHKSCKHFFPWRCADLCITLTVKGPLLYLYISEIEIHRTPVQIKWVAHWSHLKVEKISQRQTNAARSEVEIQQGVLTYVDPLLKLNLNLPWLTLSSRHLLRWHGDTIAYLHIKQHYH